MKKTTCVALLVLLITCLPGGARELCPTCSLCYRGHGENQCIYACGQKLTECTNASGGVTSPTYTLCVWQYEGCLDGCGSLCVDEPYPVRAPWITWAPIEVQG